MSQIGHQRDKTRVGERSTIWNWATESQAKTHRDRERHAVSRSASGEDVFIGSFTRHGDLERYYKNGNGLGEKKVAFRHLHIDLGDLCFLLFVFCFLLSLFANPLACRGSLFGLYLSFLLFSSLLLFFFFDEFFYYYWVSCLALDPSREGHQQKGFLVVSCWPVFPCTISVLVYKTRLLDEEEERGKKRRDASAPR